MFDIASFLAGMSVMLMILLLVFVFASASISAKLSRDERGDP